MDKKAILTFEVMMYIPRLIFLAIMVMIIIVMVEGFKNDQVDTSQVEIEVMTQRLLFSPNAISYCDERCYPGIIDINLFENQEAFNKRMSKAFNSSDSRVAFRLKIQDGNILVRDVTYNQDAYNTWYQLSKAYKQQYVSKEKELLILYRENGQNKPAKMWVRMVMQVG